MTVHRELDDVRMRGSDGAVEVAVACSIHRREYVLKAMVCHARPRRTIRCGRSVVHVGIGINFLLPKAFPNLGSDPRAWMVFEAGRAALEKVTELDDLRIS